MIRKSVNNFLVSLNPLGLRTVSIVVGVAATLLGAYLVSLHGLIVILVTVAVLLAALIFRFPFAGLLLFVGMMPLESAFLSIAGGSATYTLLLGVYLFGLWVVRLMLERRRIVLMPYAKWLLPFLAWAALSSQWAANWHLSVSYLLTLIQMFSLGLLLYNQVNDRKRLNLILVVLVASSALAVVLGYFQAGSLTEKGLLSLQSQGAKEYASFVGLAFLSGLILYFFRDKNQRNWLPLLVCAISLFPLFASGERGVLLALLVALMALVLSSQRKLRTFAYAGLAILGIYGAFLLVVRFGWLSDYVVSRFSISQLIESGGSGRDDIWRVGWQIVKDHPLIGVGLGNFTTIFDSYTRYSGIEFYGNSPHNDYLGVTAELGVIGLFLFVGMLVFLGVRLVRLFRKQLDSEMHLLSAWVFGLFVLFISFSMTSDFLYRKSYWLAVILVEVVIKVSQEPSGEASSVPEKGERRLRFRESRKVAT